MDTAFQDKSAKILVIESATANRSLLSDVLKGIGFSSIQGVATPQDAMGILEVEQVDWVVTSLYAKDQVNAMQLLQIFTLLPALQGTRVSLFLEEEEKFCLRSAFEFGLMSWHAKPFSKETLTESVGDFFKKLEANNWNTCLTSAEYLREFLQKQNLPSALLTFEKNLSSLFPGDAKLLMHLGEAQHLGGQKEAAAGSLYQASLIDASLKENIDALSKKLFGNQGLQDLAQDTKVNTLGLGNCILIDPDQTVLRAVEDILKKLNVPDVMSFMDGESAWEHIKKSPEPSLIIQEWRIPKLSGPFLMQKIRQHGYQRVPIIILSSLVKKDDMPLVREMGVANVISKPFDQQYFISDIVWTIQQDRLPTEIQTMERKILRALSTGEKAEAESLKQQYFANPQVTESHKVFIEGEFAYADKNYEKARDFAVKAVRMNESVLVLNLLGKVFMQLRQFDAALKCFEKAQTLSPLNIERLCNIAEAETEVSNKEGAATALERAKDLDEDNTKVKETEAKVEMTLGSTSKARDLMRQMQSLDNIVGFMNNRAIALTRAGDIANGIELYTRAIEALPEDQKETKSVVYYNLALAFSRNRNFGEAVTQLEKSLESAPAQIKEKASSLKTRLEEAIKTGKTAVLKFSESEQKTAAPEKQEEAGSGHQDYQNYQTMPETQLEETEVSDDENKKIVAVIEMKKGTMCSYLIFNDPGEKDPQSLQLIKTLPRFTARKAIKRAEALGVDKIKKGQS